MVAKSCLRLFGRYCPFKGFSELISSFMNSELSQKEDNLYNGLIGYQELLTGYLEALPKGEGFLDKIQAVKDIFLNLGNPEWLDNLTRYTLPVYQDLMTYVFQTVKDTATEDEVTPQTIF